MALTCCETISTLNNAARQAYYPNVNSVVMHLALGNSQMEQQLRDHAKSCVQPAMNYYFRQLTESMKEPLFAFKAARLFFPSKVHEKKPSIGAIDSVGTFPFLSAAIPGLKEEFPQYVAAVEDIDSSYDPLLF